MPLLGFHTALVNVSDAPKCQEILERVGYMVFDTWEEGVAAQLAEHLLK